MRALAVIALFAAAACNGDEGRPPGSREPVVVFDSTVLRIETADTAVTVRAEVARTPEQRAHGLMDRESLPANAGMLFLYDAPQDSASGFWMFRTLIPLDIAFLDAEGRILAIRSMRPCGSPNPAVCPRYSPGIPFSGALEVNEGFFRAHGIEPGDRIVTGRAEGG